MTNLTPYPLVSIITPSHNSAAFVERTIRSILAQDYPRIEHIIVDGASTDRTLEILRQHPHLRWISEPDHGQSDALNKGFRLAQGTIIGWLNADDTYNEGAVSAAVTYLLKHPEGALVYSHCDIIDEHDRLIGRINAPPFELTSSLLEYTLPQPTAFMRAEALASVGYVDPQLHYVMDRDLFIRLGVKYPLHMADATWANFRECQGTKTVSHPERFWLEVVDVYHRFFARPDLPSSVLAVKAQALARVYWVAGVSQQSQPSQQAKSLGQGYCLQALETYPLLDRDEEFAMDQLVHWAVVHVSENTREPYVREMIAGLPLSDSEKRRVERRALGHLYASLALVCDHLGPGTTQPDPKMRLHWLRHSIAYDPRWLRNRGVRSLLIREGLGAIVHAFRRQK